MNKDTKKAMSIFEKYLTVWVALCIIGGIILGKIAAGLARTLDGMTISVNGAPVVSVPIAICLFFMMYPIMVKIDTWGRYRRRDRRRQVAGGTPLAKLPGRLHSAGHRPLYGHGAGVGIFGQRQRRLDTRHGGDQLADDAFALRGTWWILVGCRPATGSMAGAAVINRHLRCHAAGGWVSVP